MLIYESGTIGARPQVLPLSIGDPELATTASAVVPLPEIFAYWLQGGRIDLGFLDGHGARSGSDAPGSGPQVVITDHGVLKLQPGSEELQLVARFENASVDAAREAYESLWLGVGERLEEHA